MRHRRYAEPHSRISDLTPANRWRYTLQPRSFGLLRGHVAVVSVVSQVSEEPRSIHG
jgi:hypothetical protein